LEGGGESLLKLEGCTVYYRKALALDRISMEVGGDELVSVIGANGAGKSTILKLIVGIVRPREGQVIFDGEVTSGLPPYKIVSKGIALCPEGGGLAPEMTVLENLEMGAYLRKDRDRVKVSFEEVFHIFPVLNGRKYQLAGTLSGGERKMLALGRALIFEPRLLMLDEPSQGLAPLVKKEIFSQVAQIKAQKRISCVVVEQESTYGLKISNRCYVLANGRIVLTGNSKDLLQDDSFRHAYMGID
jgi:branched-chain amino acid transport system ATP-binding protein